MLEKIKALRKKLAEHDITFWEGLPAILALIIPSILEPEWIWRLIAFFVAGLTLLIVIIHALLVPEQFKFSNVKPHNRKYFFLATYIGAVIALPIIFLYFLIPAGKDLYRVVQNPAAALEKKTIEFVEWGGGGSVTPFFVGQRFHTSDDQMFFLPFSFNAWGVGTFEVLYSAETDVIYEIKKLQ